MNEQLYAIVLTMCHEPGIGQFMANKYRPYLVQEGKENETYTALKTLKNMVIILPKSWLMKNPFDLFDEDFKEPLIIEPTNPLTNGD